MSDTSYINWHELSDQALSSDIGRFVQQNRLKQNRTQSEVAEAAGISRSTLSLLEKGETVTVTTLLQVLRVLDLLDIMNAFQVKEPEISPLAYAKLKKKERKRASSNDTPRISEIDSSW